ncbi:MAG: NAD(P)H-binding protein [Pseudomonadota bacterium]
MITTLSQKTGFHQITKLDCRGLLILAIVLALLSISAYAQTVSNPSTSAEKLLIYGASGRIGSIIVDEAISQGYQVTGVSRDPKKVPQKSGMNLVKGDILDQQSLTELAQEHDVILVSVGGRPQDPDPKEYIAYKAAVSLIQVLENMGDSAPRVIFVGNLFTLEIEPGELLLNRVTTDHRNYAMFHGHQYALEAFLSSNINWTVASPPNGLRLTGRSNNLVYGGDLVLRDTDGEPLSISTEDYAYAVIKEITEREFFRKRFTVARLR